MRPAAFRARLAKHGESVTVKKPANNSTNEYGKNEAGSWDNVTDEQIIRSYQEGGAGSERMTGGTARRDVPRAFAKADTAIEDGYRVAFPSGDEYEASSFTYYDTHTEFSLTKVD